MGYTDLFVLTDITTHTFMDEGISGIIGVSYEMIISKVKIRLKNSDYNSNLS